jgi:hypothetical protein
LVRAAWVRKSGVARRRFFRRAGLSDDPAVAGPGEFPPLEQQANLVRQCRSIFFLQVEPAGKLEFVGG